MGKRERPEKPAGSPLFPHRNGQWCKKIRNRFHYFGTWDDHDRALVIYYRDKDELEAGRIPETPREDEYSLWDLGEHFLASKHQDVESGNLTIKTWTDYRKIVLACITAIGKTRPASGVRPPEWGQYRNQIVERYAPSWATTIIRSIKAWGNWCYQNEYVDRPFRFGTEFKAPPKRAIRMAKLARGSRIFTPKELRIILAATSPRLHACILLGINGGFGNTDCSELHIESIDFEQRVINYARHKTGEWRTVPLWNETVLSIQRVIQNRTSGLVFITRAGKGLVQHKDSGTTLHRQDLIGKELRTIVKGWSDGQTFYALRHTFRTVADDCQDDRAARRIMGHVGSDIDSEYISEFAVKRLRVLTDRVHEWLFPNPR